MQTIRHQRRPDAFRLRVAVEVFTNLQLDAAELYELAAARKLAAWAPHCRSTWPVRGARRRNGGRVPRERCAFLARRACARR
eukprot:6732444-Prymnesium_polylepis.1